MGHPNKDVAMRGYTAFEAGDMATLGEVMSDDIVWHFPGSSKLAGTYTGKDEVFRLFGAIGQETEGSFSNDIHDMLANDDHVVALVRSTATRQGKSLEGVGVHVMHVTDGKLTEFWNFPEDQTTVDDFWA